MNRSFQEKLIVILFGLITGACCFGQSIRQMGFQNKPIQDILLTLADTAGTSIVCDETVVGNASFIFGAMDFDAALRSFLNAYHLYARIDLGVYYVSRINIAIEAQTKLLSVDAEDIDPQLILRALARAAGQTILYDPLPKLTVTIHSVGVDLLKAVQITVSRIPEYAVVFDKDFIYVKKNSVTSNDKKAPAQKKVFSFNAMDRKYSVQIKQAQFLDVLEELMGLEGKEFSMLMKGEGILENINFTDRDFDDMLRLILDQANADFTISRSTYYIFEVQRKDVIKRLVQNKSLSLSYISAQDAVGLLPQNFASSNIFRVDKASNTVYLTGSASEIAPIYDFLVKLDQPNLNRAYYRYRTNYITAKEIINLLPPRFAVVAPIQTPNDYVFLMSLGPDDKKDFEAFLSLVDRDDDAVPVVLKYLKVEDFLKNMPPSISKVNIQDSGLQSLIFFKGSEEKYQRFIRDLALIDKPKPQIRYDVLVVQHEQSKGLAASGNFSIRKDKSDSTSTADGQVVPTINAWSLVGSLASSAFSINFDYITALLGYTISGAITDLSQTDTKSYIFADTFLTALSGQETKFQSTTTVHYLETKTEDGVTTTTGAAQSLSYGLIFSINGWVSGDNMVTMSISATVSHESSGATSSSTSSTSLPNTSERIFSTQLRAEAGKVLTISGLIERDKNKRYTKIPILGSIPILGALFRTSDVSESVAEITFYIIPHIIDNLDPSDSDDAAINGYYKNFLSRDSPL